MASVTVSLSHDDGNSNVTAIEINGPVSPTNVDLLPMFVSDLSANNTRYSYQLTDTKVWHWSMRFDDLTTAQKNALEDFFTDTAKGPTNTFTYTHSDGETYTARFLDTALQFERRNSNEWATSFALEVTAQVNGS